MQKVKIKDLTRDFVFLLLVFSLFFAFSCDKPKYHEYGKDSFPQINLPVYPDAFQVHHIINRPEGAKSAQYKVKIKWPAQPLVDFYHSEFKRMGLSKYAEDGYGRGEWGKFIDGTKKNAPEINRYIETWVDDKHSIRILLSMNYMRIKGNPWPKEVSVVCQVSRFYDFTKLNEFDEKLRKSGKYEQFHTMIGKYIKDNNEIDIEKALKENPDNEELKEYIELLKK